MHATRGRDASAFAAPLGPAGTLLLAPLLAAGLLAGCSGATDPVVSATDATVATPASTALTPVGTDETTAAAPAPSAGPATTAPRRTSATTAVTAPVPPSTTTLTRAVGSTTTEVEGGSRVSWPKALGEPRQGDPVWAVYLVTAHSGSDPAIGKAVQQASGVGYQAVVGDLACDQGALEALNLDQYDFWSAATLYFATERDVNDFVASYRTEVADVVGYARVTLGCLD